MVSRSRTVTQLSATMPLASSPTVSKSTGDAVGGANFVLAAVALADGAGVVVVHHEVLAQLVADLHCLVTQLLAQGQDSALIGSQSRVQMQDGADVLLALAVGQVLLIISLAQEGQSHAVTAQRRLDHIGDVVLVGLAVEVLEALAGGFLMTAQVVVGAVCNAPQLAQSVNGKAYSMSVVARL